MFYLFFSRNVLAIFIIGFLCILPTVKASSLPQSLTVDPGSKEKILTGYIHFSCPNSFNIQSEKSTDRLTYLTHQNQDLSLFVASSAPDKDTPIKQLAQTLATYLYPQEKKGFQWKELPSYGRLSKYETADGGGLQGFNGNQRVCLHYRKLLIQKQQVLVGYIFGLDRGAEAKKLFDQNLAGLSFSGMAAQNHIIASMTDERFEDLSSGSAVRSNPIP